MGVVPCYLADRSLDTTRIVMEKRMLHAKIEEVQRELEEEQKATVELTRDMTRQYKGMQEELLNRVRGERAAGWGKGGAA